MQKLGFLSVLIAVVLILCLSDSGRCSQVPVYIDKQAYYTNIKPNSVPLGKASTLTVYIANKNETDISCTLKVYGENLSIIPSNESNITALGRSAYQNERETSFTFYVEPKTVGISHVTIELWYQTEQVDIHVLELETYVEYVPTPYEVKLTAVYLLSIVVVLVVYLKSYFKGDMEKFWMSLFFVLIFLGLGVFMALLSGSGEVFEAVSYILSPSVGKIELILAIAFILDFASLISLGNRPNLSLMLANVIVFLMVIPIVLDWLLLPFPFATFGGELVMELVQLVIIALLSIVLSKVISKRQKKETEAIAQANSP